MKDTRSSADDSFESRQQRKQNGGPGSGDYLRTLAESKERENTKQIDKKRGKIPADYVSFEDRQKRKKNGDTRRKNLLERLKELKEQGNKKEIEATTEAIKNLYRVIEIIEARNKDSLRETLARNMNEAKKIFGSVEKIKEQALNDSKNIPKLFEIRKSLKGLRYNMEFIEKRNQDYQLSLAKEIQEMSKNERDKFYQERAENQEKILGDCLDATGQEGYDEKQNKFNQLAHETMKKDENVKLPIYGQEKFGITNDLTIKELVQEVNNRKGDQEFRELVVASLAIRYHDTGFSDGRFVDKTKFSQDEDEVDDKTYNDVHNIITKAVESHIDKQLEQA